MDRDPQKEQDFYEKYGITNGSGRTNKLPEIASYRITFDSEKKTLYIVFVDDKLNVLDEIRIPNMCYAESVKEFKIEGEDKGSWEEVTQHKVWILLETGQKKCPWCGLIPEDYSEFNDPSYIADHRVGQCGKCKRYAFVSHDHVDGKCQPVLPESLKNYKKVEA